MSLFTISLVGRPNVGKSTLFNLLSKKKLAIVENTPGVTVDYKENQVELFNHPIKIIDTGGISTSLKPTTHLSSNIELSKEINYMAHLAIKQSNLILFIVDGKDGLTFEDKEIAILLRKTHNNIILVINKVDNKNSVLNIPEIKTLGFSHIVEISALHKNGINGLYNLIQPFFVKYLNSSHVLPRNNEDAPYFSLAIVGKPNTGKSTLINNLLQKKRLAVSEIAGTTKDSISVYVNYNNKIIRLIDTAGLARKNKIKPGVESLAKSETIRTIIFAQVVALVIDATIGLTKQDLTLANYVLKEGRALFIVLNKIDLVKEPKKVYKDIQYTLEHNFSEIKGISIILTSGLKNINLTNIFKESFKIYQKWTIAIKTSLLNRWLKPIIEKNPPPLLNGRTIKIKFISQEKSRPPTFNLWVNRKDGITPSYLRFLRNQIYYSFSLQGIPLRFNIKTTLNPYIK